MFSEYVGLKDRNIFVGGGPIQSRAKLSTSIWELRALTQLTLRSFGGPLLLPRLFDKTLYASYSQPWSFGGQQWFHLAAWHWITSS